MKRRHSQDFLQRDRFQHEPVYAESPHNPDDVLCYGSDDDAYYNPIERQLRIEHQANRFLHGLPMFIASAQLQGPFDRKSGWENPWRSRNSVTQTGQTQDHPRKRLKQSKTERGPLDRNGLSLQMEGSDASSGLGASQAHEYLSKADFLRIESWRVGVVSVPRTDISGDESPLPPTSSAMTGRPSQNTQRDLSQVINDSFDTSRLVQPSFTQADRRRSKVSSTARLSTLEHGPARSERAVSTLRDCTSLATTPGTQSPLHITPEPTPAKNPHDGASSSDLSDLSQPTPEPIRCEVQPEEETGSSQSVVNPDYVTVPAIGRLSAVQLQEYSDRSFRFRGVASRRDPATETPTDRAEASAETAAGGEDNSTELDHAPTSDETIPHNNQETTIGHEPSDRSTEESPASSIVVANETAEPKPEPPEVETPEADTTRVACLNACGDASMIDGPTLIPSMSTSDSAQSDLESMGNFSCEKQSQALPRAMAKSPRKLLWPKSNKGTADTSPGSDAEASEAEVTANAHATKKRDDGLSHIYDQRFDSSDSEDSVVSKATSADDCSNQTDDQEDEANMDGGCTSLGTPLPNHDEEQSPWRNSQIEVKPEESETDEDVDIEGQSLPTTGACFETKLQSPWGQEPAQAPKAPEQPEVSLADKDNQTSQSPWARGDSQLAAAIIKDSRLFPPLSSPVQSEKSPLRSLREIALPNLPAPSRSQGDMSENQESCPQRPLTPDFQSSSLPTPDNSRSDSGIRSFREFLTPSPQKPKRSRKRRISAVNNGQLPSTQALVDAAVSNPWLDPSGQRRSKKRQKLRVSWAPLPGEGEESSLVVAEDASSTQSPACAEFPYEPKLSSSIRLRPRSILRSSRASSPPPSSLDKDLPAEKERFGKHFAAVANRRTAKQKRAKTVILPSASQQSVGSPPISAMAERFLAAEELSSRPRAISVLSDNEVYKRECRDVQSRFISNMRSSSQLSTPLKSVQTVEEEDGDSDVELSAIEIEEEEEPEPIDPVAEVMQNLDSFLDDTWEVRQSLPVIEGEPTSSVGSRRRSGRSGLRSSGMTDTPTNVWR
ncbi:hypothetical protein QBC37DRAFT_431157 [Rhypophila decipiens]|uniref:Protamine P1 n=1 Tax=Rhypophila decipiens TaxID=261697 RepID=A0AAN7B164_9PEZI|nr:hypothetical protein QBC37DRAFT_431157 [Rhypophila decipiens]